MPTEAPTAPTATPEECEAGGGHAYPPEGGPCPYCGTEQPEPEKVTAEVVTDGRPAPSTEPDADDAEQPVTGGLVHLHPTGGSTGLVPVHDELRGMAEMAVTLALAGVMPKELRRNPANVLAVLLTGRELGVAPMTAIRTFHVIDGQVTVAPKVRMAMVRQQGLGKLWPDPDNDERTCSWFAERADQPGITFRSSYRWEQAQMARLAGPNCQPYQHGPRGDKAPAAEKCLCKDNWRNYPDRMLSWRALGYLLDDTFPEVGTGLYSPDELGAVTDADGEPVFDLDNTDPLVGGPSAQRAAGPNPNEAPPNPADLQALHERINVLRTNADAAEALKALWMAPDGDGNPKLPPLGKLLHRHMTVARAAVDAIERKAKAGEYGTDLAAMYSQQPATQPTATAAGPESADSPEGADTAPEPAGGATAADAAEPEPAAVFDEADTEALIEHLEGLQPPELRTQLGLRALATSGNAATLRHRLGKALMAEGWAPAPPDTLL